jgi:hypothetical protein
MCELSGLSELRLGRGGGPPRSGYSAMTADLLEPFLSGDKRDDRSAYAPGIGDCPVCHLAPVVLWPRLASASCGVSFPKMSKLLNQENALGAPCLGGEFCAPQAAPSRGAPMMRTSAVRRFDITLPFASPKSSGWQALMFLWFVGGNARGRCSIARPSRAVVQGGSDV